MGRTVAVMLATFLVSSPATAGSVSFQRLPDVPVDTPGCTVGVDCPDAPLRIVADDFDTDGRLDVATANNASDNVAVLLGDGTGVLGAVAAVDAGEGPSAIASGRIDSDAIPDLVVANELGNTVSVLLGTGDGTFQSSDEVEVGTAPEGVVLADFDGDGRLDLATADLLGESVEDPEDDTVSVSLGNGNGTFQERIVISVPGGPYGIAAADLDGDEVIDLAVTLSDASRDQVAVLIGQGDGTFVQKGTMAVGAFPVDVVTGDLDDDGNQDLAVANEFSDEVSILLGRGDGTFSAAVNHGVGAFPEALAAGDLDGDGTIDLVTADSFGTAEFPDGTASVLVGLGDGGFAAAESFGVGLSPFGVDLADLDGDGLPDIVTSNLDANSVSVLLNTTNAAPCAGDCDASGSVSVDELVVGTNMALGSAPIDACPSFDQNDDGQVTIDEIILAVDAALFGCRA